MAGIYFAWVDDDLVAFDPVAHAVMDEEVVSIECSHAEGEIPEMELVIKNPGVGLLNPNRKVWAWLSWFDGAAVVPLFLGLVTAVPSDMLGETLTVKLLAEPSDFDVQKALVADDLRVLPFYDPVFVPLERRDDPDEVLAGYSQAFHVDRVTHEVSTSDIVVGEDGTATFVPSEIPYTPVTMQLKQAPLEFVTVDAKVDWVQEHTGYVDIGRRSFASYSGDGIISEWPKPGTSIQGGWTVESGVAVDAFGITSTLTASWSWSWQSTAERHTNGDTISASQSQSIPQLVGPYLERIITMQFQTGVVDPFATDSFGRPKPINIPASLATTTMYVPLWQVNTSMVLRYDAFRNRSERAVFVLQADLQRVAVSSSIGDFGEVLDFNGAVGEPLISLRNWMETRGEAVALGDMIFPEYPFFPGKRIAQIAIQAGTAGDDLPDFGVLLGEQTVDGGVIWSSLGDVSPNTSPPDWTVDTEVPLGRVIRPRLGPVITYQALVSPGRVQRPQVGVAVSEGTIVRASNGSYQICLLAGDTASGESFGVSVLTAMIFGSIPIPTLSLEPNFSTTWGVETVDGSVTWASLGTTIPDGAHYYICTNTGTTGLVLPPFTQTVGAVTVDNDVEWTCMSTGELPVGGAPGDTPRRSYFPTDRGLQSLEYTICVARAKLLFRARAVETTFACKFARAVELSCRKNAVLYDARLPGGVVSGKIIKYTFSWNKDNPGQARGTVTIGSTIGRGNELVAVTGTPVYVDDGYVDVGYQQYEGATILLPGAGDVGYSPPLDAANDDGLVFPLTRAQVVDADQTHGTASAQEPGIQNAMAAASQAATIGQIQPTNAQQSIQIQQQVNALGRNTVEQALKLNPVWHELIVRGVQGGPFNVDYSIDVTDVMVPRQVDTEASGGTT